MGLGPIGADGGPAAGSQPRASEPRAGQTAAPAQGSAPPPPLITACVPAAGHLGVYGERPAAPLVDGNGVVSREVVLRKRQRKGRGTGVAAGKAAQDRRPLAPLLRLAGVPVSLLRLVVTHSRDRHIPLQKQCHCSLRTLGRPQRFQCRTLTGSPRADDSRKHSWQGMEAALHNAAQPRSASALRG